MEMRDIYRRDGTFTGMTMEKHVRLQKGQYVLHAIIIMKTVEGQYIMQQRSPKAKYSPGEWDVTGGGVTAGETTAQAAVREAYEELGVAVRPEKLVHMLREITEWGDDFGMICDTYAAEVNLPEGGFRLAEYEVNDVKCVGFEEFLNTVTYNKTEAFRDMLCRVEAEI